jgi:hypothetical protein
MIRLIPFACTSPGVVVLTIIAATIRWTNAGRRPTAGRAASTRITLLRPRQCDGTIVRLAKLLGRAKRRSIQFVQHLTGDGPTIFAHVCQLGLEGIVSKHVDSFYRSGPSKMWVKSKNPLSEAVRRETEEDWS